MNIKKNNSLESNKNQNANKVITPFIIGHRGAKGYVGENTLASIEKAYELGCTWVEIDIKLSADNQLFLLHDNTVNRTTNKSGLAIDYTIKQLKQFDASCGHETPATIPTLLETIAFLKDRKIGVNIEIKANDNQNYITGKKLALMLNDCFNSQQQPVPIISSFCFESLAGFNDYFDNKNATAEIALLYDEQLPSDFLSQVKRYNASAIHIGDEFVDNNTIEQIKANKLSVRVYTVNNAEKALKLKRLGVDAVFTDYPDLLK